MNRRKNIEAITLGACALLFTAAFGAGCEQPPLLCDVPAGPYAVKYFPKDAGNDCLMIPGELVGMALYNAPKGDGSELDVSRATVAIQATSMGMLADDARNTANATDPNPEHAEYSLGN